jgi:hypothetical protein
VPAGLAEITMRCLEKAPEARYQRGFELAEALYDWMHADGVVDAPPVRAARTAG